LCRAEASSDRRRLISRPTAGAFDVENKGGPTTIRIHRPLLQTESQLVANVGCFAPHGWRCRRRRQAEGTAKAKAAGLYKGRPANKTRNDAIASLLSDGRSWRYIMDAMKCSRTLLAKIARDRRLLKAGLEAETTD